ncbi:hypothetical protein [Sphingomonas panaciterrae]|uniref:hypothetical protein n=1 Tax=Sphingomonas panaciterrae TaxID=1462999 RepID=UPI002FEF5B8B
MIFSDTPSSSVTAVGFHTEQSNGDWSVSWSDLTSYLLAEAEKRFGSRDSRWFFTGIEYADVAMPMTYYPANRPFHVGIRLTRNAAMDARQAHFQLAHEIVHLLGPCEEHHAANVFEEGIAAAFQEEMSTLSKLGFSINVASYRHAMAAVQQLQAIDRGAVAKVRAEFPNLRQLTAERLKQIVPGTSDQLADTLCAPFARGE